MTVFLRVHADEVPVEGILNQTGNCNSDSRVDISDGVFLLSYLFSGGAAPLCQDRCRFNADNYLDVGDAVAILDYLIRGMGVSVPLVEKCDGADNTCDGVIDEGCAPPDIAWDPVVKDIQGGVELVAAYRIYMGSAGQDYVLIKEVSSDCACATLEASLLPAPSGQTYYLSVTAIDLSANESDFSAALQITW